MENLEEKLERMANPDVLYFEDIFSKMKSLYINENFDYGNSFIESCNEFGLISPIIKISDKLNRLKKLSKSDYSAVMDEKIEGTLLDLANYAVLALIWKKKHENKG